MPVIRSNASSDAMPPVQFEQKRSPAHESKGSGIARRLSSLVGGSLIGISILLPALMLEAEEGNGGSVLLGSLILGLTGLGLHLRASKRTSVPVKRTICCSES
jgi:hypothetical protein